MTDTGLSLAVVFATLAGPIFAVIITRWQDTRAKRHERQAVTFRSLMATRGAAVSPEHVGALNTVEVDFYGVKAVESAWRDYVLHLNSHPGKEANEPAKTQWEERRRDKLTLMLAEMASAIGIAKSQIEIRQGGYYPEGWATRDLRQNAAQEWILDLAAGRRALPVKVVQSP